MLPTADRSRIMRSVKSIDTKPELAVRKMIHALGYRYRLHRADLPGKPDLVFSSRRKVIFVHGCWWHGHDCPRGARLPKTNADYWTAKIARNRARDSRHIGDLAAMSWEPLSLWECELKDLAVVEARVVRFLGSRHQPPITAAPGSRLSPRLSRSSMPW